MTQSLEDIYAGMGRLIAGKLPAGWSSARVIVEQVGEGAFDWWGEYDSAAGQPSQFVVGPEISRLVLLARQQMSVPGKPAWRRATITLGSDGQFNMAFEYA